MKKIFLMFFMSCMCVVLSLSTVNAEEVYRDGWSSDANTFIKAEDGKIKIDLPINTAKYQDGALSVEFEVDPSIKLFDLIEGGSDAIINQEDTIYDVINKFGLGTVISILDNQGNTIKRNKINNSLVLSITEYKGYIYTVEFDWVELIKAIEDGNLDIFRSLKVNTLVDITTGEDYISPELKEQFDELMEYDFPGIVKVVKYDKNFKVLATSSKVINNVLYNVFESILTIENDTSRVSFENKYDEFDAKYKKYLEMFDYDYNYYDSCLYTAAQVSVLGHLALGPISSFVNPLFGYEMISANGEIAIYSGSSKVLTMDSNLQNVKYVDFKSYDKGFKEIKFQNNIWDKSLDEWINTLLDMQLKKEKNKKFNFNFSFAIDSKNNGFGGGIVVNFKNGLGELGSETLETPFDLDKLEKPDVKAVITKFDKNYNVVKNKTFDDYVFINNVKYVNGNIVAIGYKFDLKADNLLEIIKGDIGEITSSLFYDDDSRPKLTFEDIDIRLIAKSDILILDTDLNMVQKIETNDIILRTAAIDYGISTAKIKGFDFKFKVKDILSDMEIPDEQTELTVEQETELINKFLGKVFDPLGFDTTTDSYLIPTASYFEEQVPTENPETGIFDYLLIEIAVIALVGGGVFYLNKKRYF